MNTIDVAVLVACGVGPAQARVFVEPLGAACSRFEIRTPARKAAFLGQAVHESMGFQHLEEVLYYRSADRIWDVFRRLHPRGHNGVALLARNARGLANAAYAGVNGNGDEASGDGWRFRGRGLFQLTGRANYHDAGQDLGRPYVVQPELVALPADACLTAAWYWHTRKCNPLADTAQWDAITRVINGPAMRGASERQTLTEEALRALEKGAEETTR
jgi:putative chitinase